ncbi:MAG: hypothetical protein WBQ19_18590, partial [Terriglobales bacterium]
AVKRSLVAIIFICLVATSSAFGSATNIYITQTGSPSGNCTANVQTPAFFNNASNWGSGATQIGPGTTVLLCGTFTSSVQGGNVLTVQGSGSAAGPITILFDTNAQMNSAGWWGSYNADACSTCTGAITVNGFNYITIDGGTNGVIQNRLSGTPGNACSAGTCTQQPGNSGSLGIHLAGDHLIVRNLTIQGIYMNAGSSTSASDTAGNATADIRVDGAATNLQIYNNTLNSARAGIWGGFNGSTGPDNCPSAGVCIYSNAISDHAWQMTVNSAGSNNVVNVYGNNIGDGGSLPGWLNWQYPTGQYHQDGIFIWGSSNNQVVTAYVYNNYIHGDLGQGSPSGMIYCANNGVSGSGTGCALTAFNNVIVGTGSAATNDQIIAVKADVYGVNMGPVNLYNNTLIGGAYSLEIYNVSGGPSFALTAKNSIFYPGDSATPRWFFHQEDSGSPISSITSSNNLYNNGNSTAWNYNGGQYGTLSAWQAACGCDASPSAVSNPNLSATYTLQSGSPAIGLGANLTPMSVNSLDVSYNEITRAASGSCKPGVPGCWDAGANQFGGNSVSPPTGLMATVQ